ncbi:MAG: cytochrome P460 family protein [Armatimonadetes bacterium]|nr:cytochrome P460 family protein [Armatimonadota bacterium]
MQSSPGGNPVSAGERFQMRMWWVVSFVCLLLSGCVTNSEEGQFPASTPGHTPDLPFALPSTVSRDEFESNIYAFLNNFQYRELGWAKDKRVRDTGPFLDGTYYGTHPAVRVYYSPAVIEWLKGGRVGDIPDGAVIVKEQYNPPSARYDGLTESQLPAPGDWTVMVRDHRGSRDGWFWVYFEPGQAIDNNDPPFSYPNSGFGEYCLRCHSSADEQHTFVDLSNIEGFPGLPLVYADDGSWKNQPGGDFDDDQHPNGRALPPGQLRELKEFLAQAQAAGVESLPGVTTDTVVASALSPTQFLSSDQCLSCHSGDSSAFGPNMFFEPENIDVSPFGEWSWSMMGLSGRDPIFYAQLDSEMALHDHDGELTPAEIQDTCLSCHGVMGQRQFHIDHPGELFTQDKVTITDPSSPFATDAALARDGVSCTVCHQIEDNRNVPLQQIQTGRFQVTPLGPDGTMTLQGPFSSPTGFPMFNALGTLPVQSDFISTSRLCASCHTVFLPVLDENNNIIDHVYEQSTYLEHVNSRYRDGSPTQVTCQQCHMPDSFPGKPSPLAFKIANVEDQSYPETTNREPDADIEVAIRPGYRRHTLLGINQFALEMFNQFPDLLGVTDVNFMSGATNGLTQAILYSNDLARNQSAGLELLGVARAGSTLYATVRVTNLTGHRFPSGVGFRRAFLELVVRDGAGDIVFSSGSTNSDGEIVDQNGDVLPTEFFEVDPATGQQRFQPHHERITRDDQVQIFEELVKGPDGRFTTSFLSILTHVKDNRLLPIGWTLAGPPGFEPEFAEATAPKGNAANDPDFTDGTGSDDVEYEVALPPGSSGPYTVSARMYYQAIPPYYLADRFGDANGSGTRRLKFLVDNLDVARTNFPTWKLLVDEGSQTVVGSR